MPPDSFVPILVYTCYISTVIPNAKFRPWKKHMSIRPDTSLIPKLLVRAWE